MTQQIPFSSSVEPAGARQPDGRRQQPLWSGEPCIISSLIDTKCLLAMLATHPAVAHPLGGGGATGLADNILMLGAVIV